MRGEAALLDELLGIRAHLLAAERRGSELLAQKPPDEAESARNFLHYHALRALDVRPVQEALSRMGLSSLGRAEAHVLATLDAVVGLLASVSNRHVVLEPSGGAPSFDVGRKRLDARATALFGRSAANRAVRIMVTLSERDAAEPARVRALVDAGMDLARINCAHDDEAVWSHLVRHVRAAAAESGRPCRVMMDLAGPKLRTGPVAGDIVLRVGDLLRLLREDALGAPGQSGAGGDFAPAHVACSLPEALDAAEVGHAIGFDDGKFGGIVRGRAERGILVEITHAPRGGGTLRQDKGINLPDTIVQTPALTEADRACLPFVARHADIVALSFLQSERDVRALEEELVRLEASCGMVLKIETNRAFRALPRILLHAPAGRPIGVMIARGDLAVEVGFERLAEVQEEMLWLCEAAHVPIIWATQVLEGLSRKGLPTRAEITDAAMAVRAECVMLNKGDHVVEAVAMLDGVLGRMAAHQYKKTPSLRPLSLSKLSPL
jgi:pyruvate kinase